MRNPFDRIKVVGDPILAKKLELVAEVNDSIRQILTDMAQIMYEENGVGLAANQIGIDKRLLVIDMVDGPNNSNNPRYYVNPEVIWSSEDKDWFDEPCLSLPGTAIPVKRPTEVKVSYLDFNGHPQTDHCTEYYARVIQHEIDHLNGKLAIDHLPPKERLKVIQQIKKARQKHNAQKAQSPDLATSF